MSVVRAKTFENTSMAAYLRDRIDELAPRKSQRDIAIEAGYDKPNIISMFKRGETKVPFDKVPALSKALEVDMVKFLRLFLEQPGGFAPDAIDSLLANLVTDNEMAVVEAFRDATNGRNPRVTSAQRKEIAKAITSAMNSTSKVAVG